MDKRSLIFILALSAGLFFVNQWFTPSPTTPAKPAVVEAPSITTEPSADLSLLTESNGELYVLENEYQQIVFSSVGGSVSEINLPLQSQSNEKSIVLPIGFDRTMEENYPYNDHFPDGRFWTMKTGSLSQVPEGTLGGYYPLLRRNILNPQGKPTLPLSARYFAFNVISDMENLHNNTYHVTRFEKNLIEFSYADAYRKITKTYTLASEDTPYCLELEVKVEGDGRGLWLTTGVPDVELISGNFSPLLKYLTYNQKTQVENLSLPKATTTYSSIQPSWISNSNGFLGLILQPLSDTGAGFRTQMIPGNLAPTRLSIIDPELNAYPTDKYPGYEVLLPLKSNQPIKMRVFAGPYQDGLLKGLDATFSKTEKNPNFSLAMSFQGWLTFISEPFAKFLFLLMKFFYQITNSWGFSIILLTVALRVMLYPLNGWSIKSSLKMQQVAPQVTALQEKYKKDPKKAQMEVLALYREKGVNPMTGCLPVLIQIPFLIGMFDLLKSAFDLRGASFIPGWIPNLTAPDVVFSWGFPIWFIGTSFHLLPVLLGLSMFLQQRMSSQAPKDPKLMTDSQKQQKMMGNIMTLVFTVMFYSFPSGLNIYWLSSTLLSVLQQWITSKQLKGKALVKKT